MTSFINKMKKLRDLYKTNLENKYRTELCQVITTEKLRLMDILIKEYEK